MMDISVILTAHREGPLCGPAIHSMSAAIADVREKLGKTCEIVVVLDRTNEITRTTVSTGLTALDPGSVRIIETDEGDPGQTRNRGIEIAAGLHATFLDGDHMWSANWLTQAWKLIDKHPNTVAQSMYNVVFGEIRNLWWHVDSEGPLFDPRFLDWSNYWDAMSLARTDTYRRVPFKRNDIKLGFGHEDWHWSCATHALGIPHKPAPDTIHFKRRRRGSQMHLVDAAGCVVWPE